MVYDVRREIDLARLDRQTSVSSLSSAGNDTSDRLGSEASATGPPRKSTKAKPWANLWKEKRKNGEDYLLAAEDGNMQEMLDLLDSSKKMLQVADINTKGADHWTALHYAANEGHGDILEVLIDKNIDVEAVTNQKRTALHLASARGNLDICRLLCD